MPDPHAYPEAPNGPLLLPAAMGTPKPTFAPIEQLARHEPTTPDIAKTMFIRVAMSDAACPDITSANAPSFYLRADSGDAVLINDRANRPNQTYPIFRRPGSDFYEYIGDGSAFLEGDNVFRLVVTINDPGGEHAWQLGIWNNDPTAERHFTWVVSGTDAEAAQPWLHVAPAEIRFEAFAGETPGKPVQITISNFGTAAATISEVTPRIEAPFAMSGLPATLKPNSSAIATVTFDVPNTPGDTGPAIFNFISSNKKDPGPFSKAHNNQISLRAHVRSNVVRRADLLWTVPVPGLSFTSAGVHGDRFIYGTHYGNPDIDRGSCWARKLSDGQELWQFKADGAIHWGVTVGPSGVAYFGVEDAARPNHSFIYALDAQFGRETWPRVSLDGRPGSSPVIVGTRLLVLLVTSNPNTSKVHAIDIETGRHLYTVDFPPNVFPGIVVQSATECWFVGLTIDSFNVMTQRLQTGVHHPPLAKITASKYTPDRVYYASGPDAANLTTVIAVDKSSWTTIWSAQVPDRCLELFASDELVIAVQSIGPDHKPVTFRALDAGSGAERWQYAAGNDDPKGLGLFVRNLFVTQLRRHESRVETVGIDTGTGHDVFRFEAEWSWGWIVSVNDSLLLSSHVRNILCLGLTT